MSVQDSFAMIHKSRIPDAAKRGHLFEMGVTRLAEWWISFFEVTPTGHLRSRTFNDVQSELIEKGLIDAVEDVKGKGRYQQLDDDDDMEVIRSEKSLMKHALQRFGSRDVSAQLFTALCRALGIPARLVASLQSVPWQSSVGKPKNTSSTAKQGKGKEKAPSVTDGEHTGEADSDMEEVPVPSHHFPGEGERLDGSSSRKGKKKAKPAIKLRATKSKVQTLGSSQIPSTSLNMLDLEKLVQIS
jgi:xeroderma pigmentosum group C-complementing protein